MLCNIQICSPIIDLNHSARDRFALLSIPSLPLMKATFGEEGSKLIGADAGFTCSSKSITQR